MVRRQHVSVVRTYIPITTSLRRFLQVPKETPNNVVVVVRLYHVSELRCCDGLYVSKLLCHELNLVGFHVSFKYQIKHQFFLVPTSRETIRVVWIKH